MKGRIAPFFCTYKGSGMHRKRKNREKKLGEILIERGVIKKAHLTQALKEQRRRAQPAFLGEILVELQMAAEDAILEAFLAQYNYAYIPVDQYNLDCNTIASLPASLAHKYFVLPINKVLNTITVAMMNPRHTEALREIAAYTQCSVVPCIAKPSQIKNQLQIHYAHAE